MNRSRCLLLAALAPLILTAPAGAAGFGPAQTLDVPMAGPLASALGPRGAAVVAGLRGDTPIRTRIELASRSTAASPWRLAGFATGAGQVRDVQVVIGRSGTVVAWAQAGRRSQAVVVATADAGSRLTVRGRFPVRDAFAASPRLAVLRGGAVVAAWRDGRFRARSLVRVATIDGGRFAAAPRTAGTNAAQVVLAANGGGATVGWTSPYRAGPRKSRLSVRRPQPRSLTLRPLDAHGLPTGAPQKVAADVDSKARLAGAPDGRLVASWMRPQKIRPYPGEDRGDAPPPSAYIRPRAFTRQVFPRALPARPLGGPDEFAAGLPSVAFDGADHAVAVLRMSVALMGPAFDVRTAESTGGGPWSATRPLANLGFSLFDPVVAAPASGGTVVVFTAVVVAAGKPVWTVDAADATGTQVLGVTDAGDGRGVAVAREGSAVLVAWPAAGGVQVVQRG